MGSILRTIADNKFVQQEQKIAFGAEKGLRIVESCALLAVALNHKQFALLGRTVNLAQVGAWANWGRGLIFAHLFLHDVVGASKTETEPSQPDALGDASKAIGTVLDFAVTCSFLHDNGVIDLREQAALFGNVASGTFIAYSVLDLPIKVKQWESCDEKDLERSRRELIHSCANLFLWVPATFGVGGDLFKAAAGIVTGITGCINSYKKGLGESE